MDAVPGTIEVHAKAGDASMFVDSLMHGGSSRTTVESERWVIILRYGPSWVRTRFGYTWSDVLLSRITPQQREILQSRPPVKAGDPKIPYQRG